MRKVIGIGETVLDIIFKNGKPIEAVPGGSSFNAVISLGRAGVNTSFISEAGNDRIGEYVIEFLRENGVNADNVSVFPDSKSPLSLAFLDENNNADYIFYKDHPHDQLEFATPEINAGDIVLFGSFFALNPVVRPQVAGFLEYAKSRGAILYYDVNFRASHQNEIMKITPNLIENLEMADFVRGSHEDFGILYKKPEADKVYNAEISFYCKKFICTQGGGGVLFWMMSAAPLRRWWRRITSPGGGGQSRRRGGRGRGPYDLRHHIARRPRGWRGCLIVKSVWRRSSARLEGFRSCF